MTIPAAADLITLALTLSTLRAQLHGLNLIRQMTQKDELTKRSH